MFLLYHLKIKWYLEVRNECSENILKLNNIEKINMYI